MNRRGFTVTKKGNIITVKIGDKIRTYTVEEMCKFVEELKPLIK